MWVVAEYLYNKEIMNWLELIAELVQDKVELIGNLEEIIPYAPTTEELINKEIDELWGLIRDIIESNN